jgi:hypothetical protein
MPQPTDFRGLAFEVRRIESSGRFLGRAAYWKLYALENLIRVVIHSVLSAAIHSNWWAVAVDSDIQAKAKFRRSNYRSPWHTRPASHDIYNTFLRDLNEIIRANANLFRPKIPNIDEWILRIELIPFPRNVVCHMNFLETADRGWIDTLYSDLVALVRNLQANRLTISNP